MRLGLYPQALMLDCCPRAQQNTTVPTTHIIVQQNAKRRTTICVCHTHTQHLLIENKKKIPQHKYSRVVFVLHIYTAVLPVRYVTTISGTSIARLKFVHRRVALRGINVDLAVPASTIFFGSEGNNKKGGRA